MAAASAVSPPPAAFETDCATSTTSCLYGSSSSGAFDCNAVLAVCSAATVSVSTLSGEDESPNPVPCTAATSRMSSLELLPLASARCLASAPASLNVSKKLRSLSETSKPLPTTPLCSASHSCSVKSAFVAIH